ncbi:MAG: DUF4430 domain-containing protein [Lachnospiraceae bacterium]|nr:DUF4430 domain-containing protein [Lachnospiraceae bacterium]
MNNRKIKWIVGVAIIIILGFVAINNVQIKSVDTYRKEQQQLADTGVLKNKEGEAQIIFEDGDEVSKEEVSEAVKDQAENDKKNTKDKKSVEDKNQEEAKTSSEETDSAENHTEKKADNKTAEKKDYNNTKSSKKTKNSTKSSKNSTKSSNDNSKKHTDKTEKNKNVVSTNETDNSKENKNSDGAKVSGGNSETTAQTDEKYIECSIEINCFELSNNPELVQEKYKKYIPAGGVVLGKITVKVLEGTTVYDILNAACKKENIAIDASFNALYKAYYVKSIHNLPEKAAGDMSGWVYTINGKSPMLGASAYKVSEGDSIVWSYTVDGVPN